MNIYIFEIANLAGMSVAVVIARDEKEARVMLSNSMTDDWDRHNYIWRLKEVKPIAPGVVYRDWE